MKGQTKNLTGQVRDALPALPDTVFMETLARWLDRVDEQLLDWGDACREALGYPSSRMRRARSMPHSRSSSGRSLVGHVHPGWFQTLRRCALPSAISRLNSFTTACLPWRVKPSLNRPPKRRGDLHRRLGAMATISCAAWPFICAPKRCAARNLAASSFPSRPGAEESRWSRRAPGCLAIASLHHAIARAHHPP
jgi:hypothetical protein